MWLSWRGASQACLKLVFDYRHHTCSPSIWLEEAGGSGIQGLSQVHIYLEVNLVYLRPTSHLTKQTTRAREMSQCFPNASCSSKGLEFNSQNPHQVVHDHL